MRGRRPHGSMMFWRVPAHFALSLLLLRYTDALQISAAVEHAIGDGPFIPAGHIQGFIEPQALHSTNTIQYERHDLSAAEQQQLQAAAHDAGLFKLRVGQKLVTAIPARCLVAAGGSEHLTGAVTPSGELVALAYDLSQMQCEPAAAQTTVEGGKLAKRVPLLLTMPVAVPAIQKEARLPADGQRGGRGAAGGAPAQQAGPGAKEEGAGGGEKEAPPPDNRTWLQKNWIYFLPVAFMLLNGVAGGERGQQRGQPAATGQRQRQGTR